VSLALRLNFARRVEGYGPVYEPTLFVKVRFYVRVVHRHLKVVDNDFGDVLKISCRFEVEDRREDDGHDGNDECKDGDNESDCFPHCPLLLLVPSYCFKRIEMSTDHTNP